MATMRRPAKKQSQRSSDDHRPSAETVYRQSALRAVLTAAVSLSAMFGGSVGRRKLINFLRGNQLPPRRDGGAPLLECYALFESCRAEWVEEAVEKLLEAGYLTLLPGKLHKLVVSSQGNEAPESDRAVPESLFPLRPRLGGNEKVEAKLRALRRELAASEGRAPFSIFPNATLAALSATCPRSVAELALVPGLGEARIRRYGGKILAVLRRS